MSQQNTPASAWRPGQTSSRSASAFIIEVLVVIAILGIMGATAAFSMNNILQRAAKAARSTHPDAQLTCPVSTQPTDHSTHAPRLRGPPACEPKP